MKNGDKPAFQDSIILSEGGGKEHCFGLTKREYFAAMAMQGIVSNPGAANSIYKTIPLEGGELLAKASLVAADALLKALES